MDLKENQLPYTSFHWVCTNPHSQFLHARGKYSSGAIAILLEKVHDFELVKQPTKQCSKSYFLGKSMASALGSSWKVWAGFKAQQLCSKLLMVKTLFFLLVTKIWVLPKEIKQRKEQTQSEEREAKERWEIGCPAFIATLDKEWGIE